MRIRRRVGKLKRTGIEGYHPIRIAIRWTNPFHREVGLKDRIERRVKSEGPRIHSDVDGERILPKTEVIVRCVRKGVQTVQVCEKVGRQFAAGKCAHACPLASLGCEIPSIRSVQNWTVDLAQCVAADEIASQLDTERLRNSGTFSFDTKSAAGRSGSRTVFIDDIVGNRNDVISCYFNAVPLIAVNRVVNDVVWPAIGIIEGNGVATIPIGQIINDQSSRITARDGYTAVARATSVTKDAIEFDVDFLIAVVTSHQRNRLTACSSNSQTTYRYEFGLLDPDRPSLCTLRTGCTREYDLSWL